ncbi:hypothetical protein EV1_036317 [Malus domestica]
MGAMQVQVRVMKVFGREQLKVAGFINQSLVIPKEASPFANTEECSSSLRWNYAVASNTPDDHPHALMPPLEIESVTPREAECISAF